MSGFQNHFLTSSDGSIDFFMQPGKEHFAYMGTVFHAQGTWLVKEDGQFCVVLTWSDTKRTHHRCWYLFDTPNGYGAGRKSATHLEIWDISDV
ncbi:hypothetical protein QFZ98_001495 [Paraburkholderia youngii]